MHRLKHVTSNLLNHIVTDKIVIFSISIFPPTFLPYFFMKTVNLTFTSK